jgi:hypothetical protein
MTRQSRPYLYVNEINQAGGAVPSSPWCKMSIHVDKITVRQVTPMNTVRYITDKKG